MFVVGANQIGGSERQAWTLVRTLLSCGSEARLVFLERPRRRGRRGLPLEGIPHTYLWSSGWTRRLAEWLLRRELRRFAPHAVFLYNLEAMQHGAIAGRGCGVPLYGSVRGLQFTQRASIASELRTCARELDGLTTNCRAIADALDSAGIRARSDTLVISNAIESGEKMAAARDSRLKEGPLFLFVGSLKEVKAPELFVEAAASVQRRRPDARFLMAGDGPLRPALQQRRSELGLDEHLSMPGVVPADQIPYGKAAAVVSTSWREGASNALLEAFAHGTPVVATSVGGSVELVTDSGAGVLVPPGDAEALAEAMLSILDPQTWNLRQSNGRAYAESVCSVSRVVQLHLEMIQRPSARTEESCPSA